MKQIQLRNTRIHGRDVPKVGQKLVALRKQKDKTISIMKTKFKGLQASLDTIRSMLRNRN